MKRSELKEFIKGEIVTSLSEASPEDVDNQKELNKELEKTAKLSKDLGLEEANIGLADLEETGYEDGEKSVAMHFNQDVIGINNDVDFQAYRKGFIQAVVDSTKSFEINEDIDDEDGGDDDEKSEKDAIAQANAARGKHKKLDIAVKALKDITTEMKSLARDYSKADGVEKEKIKDQLKVKTPKKKELEALVAKLEKNVI
jgi:hypothetical protein